MKSRIALELRRSDITADIANAISTALLFYKYQPFNSFNTTSLQAFPASDGETGNPWMNDAEALIRNRAKAELYAEVMKEPTLAKSYLDLADQWAQKLTLSTQFQNLSAYTAGTLGYMVARIQNELERSDLVNEVRAAITTAIGYFQNERAYFNESRDNQLTLNAQQYIYGSNDASWIPGIIKIDHVFVYIGGLPYRVIDLPPEEMEWSHLVSPATDPVGQPYRFTCFEQKLYIYPTPDQTYTVRVTGQFPQAAPANDTVTGNIWMTDAEDLIRCRAKYELYMHIPRIMDPTKAMQFKELADEAFIELKHRQNDLDKEGDYEVRPWGY
jgi:hypothetical protein